MNMIAVLRNKRMARGLVTVSIGLLGLVDWQTGHELNFFVFYFIPVAAAAWYTEFAYAVCASVLSALVWFGADLLSSHVYTAQAFAVWNTTIRLVSFLAIGGAVWKMRQALDQEQKSAEALRRALSEVKLLESFLPICSECKKIKNEDGEWQQMESYIGQHSNTHFSHGYCPDCAKRALREAGM
ncbi:MAG: hypothetical protein FJ224_01930 [Lentisphaerae bacterium]|nr:hypothetical protein [Lentisphaerota bacterium]